jgi:ferritin-like metal-binding protein YciE
MAILAGTIETLDDLFLHQLRDIHYAEHKILKNLPVMIERANNLQLKNDLAEHFLQTRRQIERLEAIFKLLDAPATTVTCPAIDGIIQEAEDVIGETADFDAQDAALVAAAQTIEHYEIARYGTLVAWARQLGRHDCARLLRQTLEEEKTADQNLTAVAEIQINMEAV